MGLTLRNKISITQIAYYSPLFFVAVFLFFRHGWGRNAAWFYLCGFSLIRIASSSLQLATIDHPLDVDINTAGLILQNVGISPLILVVMCLLGRVLASLRGEPSADNGRKKIPLRPVFLRAVQSIILVGLILAIVAGVKAGDEFEKTLQFILPAEGKWGLGFIIAGYVLLLLATGFISYYASWQCSTGSNDHAARIQLLIAVTLSLPFIAVRVAYGCLATFTTDARFNSLTGDDYYYLGMAVLMEIMVTIVCVAVGGSLNKEALRNENEVLHRVVGRIRKVGSEKNLIFSQSAIPSTPTSSFREI